jgi:hypothetical protein
MQVTNTYSMVDWTVQAAENVASWPPRERVHLDPDVVTSHKLHLGDARGLDCVPNGSGAALPPCMLMINQFQG